MSHSLGRLFSCHIYIYMCIVIVYTVYTNAMWKYWPKIPSRTQWLPTLTLSSFSSVTVAGTARSKIFFRSFGKEDSTRPCYECKGCHGLCLLTLLESNGHAWPNPSPLHCNFLATSTGGNGCLLDPVQPSLIWARLLPLSDWCQHHPRRHHRHRPSPVVCASAAPEWA